MIKKIVFLSLVFTGIYSLSFAKIVTLSWDANTEADLAGYKCYYDIDSGSPYSGKQSFTGESPIIIPIASLSDKTKPVFQLELPDIGKFYFVVTAYDTEGLESDYSNEVSTDFSQDGKLPAKPSGLKAMFEKLVSWFKGLFGNLKIVSS